ncbi:MAG: ABC transporter ATP-binding protein [Alphaproteobacteria bacterium]|nr:MAG: ABC transporter ATP-binding protein [Alphaproteobacteria bacterium]
MTSPLLTVEDLRVVFEGDRGTVTEAVAGVSFSLAPGRTLGIVGESGCGKSVTALSIMRLLPKTGTRVSGSVVFEGRELGQLPERQMQDLRGNRLAMIFQEPMTSLNPSFTIGDQIGEVLSRHRGLSASAARRAAIDMLERVRMPSPHMRVDEYPHKLSGGMRQRVMIAMALACAPTLLIADEPTTALDVTIQAQILDLLRKLREETGTAIVLITHDLGVVAETCDDVAVMYAGEIVELAPAQALFAAPQHPYTVGLLGSIPLISATRERLLTISGSVPTLSGRFTGCRFAARCPFADAHCRAQAPPLAAVGASHLSRCWKAPLEALVA